MPKTCAIVGCRTGHKRKKGEPENVNTGPVFDFPEETKDPELRSVWIKFVNRVDWAPSLYVGICSKHFDTADIKHGPQRITLERKNRPIPTIYDPNNIIPKSLLPTPITLRKAPTDRNTIPDEKPAFIQNDHISSFTDLNETLCPIGYTFLRREESVIYYKMELVEQSNAPKIVASILIDTDMHVKLFKDSAPVPLPGWFRHGTNCTLKSKGSLQNFPTYIKNYEYPFPDDLLKELHQIRYYKPKGRPKYSTALLRFALQLRYTSAAAYRKLLEHFPLPSMDLLKKLKEGGIDPLKAAKRLLDDEKIDSDVLLLADEMYLFKEEQYQDGDMIGKDEKGDFYKGVVMFEIVGMRKNIPIVIKAVPETTISWQLLRKQIVECITSLNKLGFKVRAVLTDDHSSNVSAFNSLISSYGFDPKIHGIKFASNINVITYLFFDTVHLVKNIRNNLLNYKRFIFPQFEFRGFYDPIVVPAGEISWRLLHNVHDRDQALQSHLRQAPKLTYRALHIHMNIFSSNLR